MGIEKIIKLTNEYLSEYLWVFMNTLRKPELYLEPIKIKQKKSLEVPYAETSKRINPKLLLFALISIFITTSILSLITSLTHPGAIITKFIYILLFWLFIGTLSYLLLRLFRKEVEYINTVSLVVQLFSVIDVVSAFIGLLGGVIIKSLPIAKPVFDLHSIFSYIDDTLVIFYLSQALLTAIYLPIVLIRFRDARQKTPSFPVSIFVSILIIILAALLALSSSAIAISVCAGTSGFSDSGGGCGGG